MTEVLLVAGRSGSGKTTVAFEVSDRLRAAGIAHCLVDGDNLDAAYPLPAGDPDGRRLTEANLAALWRNYAAGGQHRMIYVNTNSVLDRMAVVRAVGGSAHVVGVVLDADDATVHKRLSTREMGGALAAHLERSAAASPCSAMIQNDSPWRPLPTGVRRGRPERRPRPAPAAGPPRMPSSRLPTGWRCTP